MELAAYLQKRYRAPMISWRVSLSLILKAANKDGGVLENHSPDLRILSFLGRTRPKSGRCAARGSNVKQAAYLQKRYRVPMISWRVSVSSISKAKRLSEVKALLENHSSRNCGWLGLAGSVSASILVRNFSRYVFLTCSSCAHNFLRFLTLGSVLRRI